MSGEAGINANAATEAAPVAASTPSGGEGKSSDYSQNVKDEARAFFGRPAFSNPIKGLAPLPVDAGDFFQEGDSPVPAQAGTKPVAVPPAKEAGGAETADKTEVKAKTPGEEEPPPKGLPVQNFFTKEEKALFEQAPPELADKVAAFIAPYVRQDKAREKGVQKYIKDLGPLSEIAKDPGSVGLIRLAMENPSLLQGVAQMATGFIKAANEGKAFNPADVFQGTNQPAAKTAPALPDSLVAEREAKVAKWLAMSDEDANMAAASEPAEVLRIAVAARNETQALYDKAMAAIEEVKQQVAPVTELREQAQQRMQAEQATAQWVDSLPEEFQNLTKDERGEVLGAVLQYYETNKEALHGQGHPELSIMQMGYQEAMHKRQLAALDTGSAAEKAAKEAQARATRTASPAAGSAPPAAKSSPSGTAQWLLERARTGTLRI